MNPRSTRAIASRAIQPGWQATGPIVLLMMLSFLIASTLGGHLLAGHFRQNPQANGAPGATGVPSAWLGEWAYTRADAYFLRGTGQGFVSSVLGIDSHHDHNGSCRDGARSRLGWLEALGRHLHVDEHSHMEDANDSAKLGAQAREVMPWIKLAVTLHPNHLDAWLLGAHLLRRSMNNHAEAERFLIEALRHNPNHHEIHFPLGQIMEEYHHDARRARGHWLDALRDCEHRAGVDGDPFVMRRIVGSLARLEEREGRLGEAMTYLARLKECSPNPHLIERWMQEVQVKIAAEIGTAVETSDESTPAP